MITQISPEVKAIQFQNFGSIVYLLQLPNNNILIDTSSKENSKELLSSLTSINLTPKDINTIILTHAHYDHTENINLFPNAKIYGNFTKQINSDHAQKEIPNILPIEKLPNAKIEQSSSNNNYEQKRIIGNQGEHKNSNGQSGIGMEDCSQKELKIHKTPGHTEGDILIQYKNILFSGDIIFHNGYIGRTDFPESNPEQMKQSLEFIKTLNFDILCPGH